MIPAVAQTLAEFLSSRLSRIGTEQISFEHPNYVQNSSLGINLYFYDIQAKNRQAQLEPYVSSKPLACIEGQFGGRQTWFDVSFLLTVKDNTRLGEQHLLSEVFLLFSQCRYLPRRSMAPALKGSEALLIRFNDIGDPIQFWRALQIPMHPALHITVTVPSEIFENSLI